MNISSLNSYAVLSWRLLMTIVTLAILSGCASEQIPAPSNSDITGVYKEIESHEPIKIATTTNILKDWIENVGGSQVEVHALVPK